METTKGKGIMTDLIAQAAAFKQLAKDFCAVDEADLGARECFTRVAELRAQSAQPPAALKSLRDMTEADFDEVHQPPAAQPEVAYYVYEWDTASGVHRDTSPNQWNGMPPTRSVPVFRQPDPRIAALERDLAAAQSEASSERIKRECAERRLAAAQAERDELLSQFYRALGQRNELQADAERYRWLRNVSLSCDTDDGESIPWAVYGTSGLNCVPIWHEELDAAIDAAMKGK